MARKNRKLAKAPNKPAGMVAALFAAVSLGMLAYLQLQGTCEETGARIKQLERSREALKKKVDNEEVKWSSASAVPNMQRLMELHGIEMTWPAESQIVRVVAVRDDLPGDGAVSYAQK